MKPKQRNALKILVVETANMNLGDNVIADNVYYLLNKALHGKRYDILRYSIFSRDPEQIRYVDAVVFAGGILKATTENFWLYIPELIRAAQEYQVPVLLSGIGVEAFYPDDERSIALKEAINLPCVKAISVRDDVETLKRDYITNPSIRVTSVYDHAIWCPYAYRKYLKKQKTAMNTPRIGLGIVREKLFADYGHPEMDRQRQLEFWTGIIHLLEAKHLQWVLFTNGDTYDELFANEVLKVVGHGEKLPAPKDSARLVQNISMFQGIIAGRMHSNIIAYSLGIPSIGMIWNQKLEFWGKKIEHPERFLPIEQMSSENAVNALFRAMDEKTKPRYMQRATVYKEIRHFVRKQVNSRGIQKEPLPYQQVLLAPALGGIDRRYRNTNSREAFEYSLQHGYINFEVDLRLTSDNILVCVNRWHKDTMKLLNIPTACEGAKKALSFEEFSNAQYYNRIPTMSFKEFAKLVSEETRAVRIILSVGQPSKAGFAKICKRLQTAAERYSLDLSRFLIQLEREEDVAFFKSINLPIEIVYYVVRGAETETMAERCRKAIAYCKAENIEYIAMNGDFYTDEIAAIVAKAPLKLCLFSYVRTDKIMRAIENGVFYVGSHYYDVQYLERLTQ